MDIQKYRVEAILTKVIAGEPIGPRGRAVLAGAPNGTVNASVASDIGYSGDDLPGAASFALKVADRRLEMLDTLGVIAGGRLPPEEDRARFLSDIRMSKGAPSDALCIAFDVAIGAQWVFVAEAIERRFNAKPARRVA